LPVCWATCLDIGREHAGTVSGTMNSLGQIGGVIAPVLIGWLVESTGAWQLPLLIAAGYYGVSAVLWLAIDPEKPLTQPLAEPGLQAA
jgi:nitrate/nitrite transporter NarK